MNSDAVENNAVSYRKNYFKTTSSILSMRQK